MSETAQIVICDDEPHILRAAEFKFRQAGYVVRAACDGEDAWQLIEQQCPDLLVTDYQMPRLNGLELITRLRANDAYAELPVLLLTAKGMELSFEELRPKLAIFALLNKPFSPRELLQTAQHAIATSALTTCPK